MSGTAISKPEARVIETEVEGERVLMNVETGHFFALRETGLAIWRLIDGERDAAAIVAALRGEYEVPEDECRAEVDAFLETLAEAGLIT